MYTHHKIKHGHMPAHFLVASFLALLFVVVGWYTTVFAQASTLSNYAWSSNIGWVSMSDPVGTNYGVTLTRTGAQYVLSGYAWSSNIGWVRFGGVSGCPSPNPVDGTCDPTVDTSDGAITGWARACSVYASGCSGSLAANSVRGGWDGWISLNWRNTGSGPLYGWWLTGSRIEGFAWGGPVIGWLSAEGTGYQVNTNFPPPTASIEVSVNGGAPVSTSPVDIFPGDELELNWISDAISCSSLTSGDLDPADTDTFSTGSVPVGSDNTVPEPIDGGEVVYSVFCDGLTGSVSDSITVRTLSTVIELEVIPTVTDIGGMVEIVWDVRGNDPTACSLSGPGGFSAALSTASGSMMSPAVQGESTYNATCGSNGFNPGASQDATVRITGTLIET